MYKFPYDRKIITYGQQASDIITKIIRSWTFIIIHTVMSIAWVSLNVLGPYKWDPYPFETLRLILVFQSSYTSFIILMSQGRQSEKDRVVLNKDYELEQDIEKKVKEQDEKLSEILDILKSRK
jgi:uncharacterized membrane protein